ncbi:MAG: class I SAM-dependent methyltransferase [Proteobacteria bacterium]|nr:class I SAM-dependent methyltransferase [Pseudomonadota bacterium]
MTQTAAASAYEAAFPQLGVVKGLTIVAPGCGEGRMVRLMAAEGAHVTGLESNPARLAEAQATAPVAGERFLEGEGDKLPFADGSVDAVVYFGTLHHVPVEGQVKAVSEAARVVKKGGRVYISEPLAQGPYFKLLQPVDDETFVRASALEAIRKAGEFGLTPEAEFVFKRTMRFVDFAAFKKMVLTIGPERVDDFKRTESQMQTVFAAGVSDGGQMTFEQPFRVNIFKR